MHVIGCSIFSTVIILPRLWASVEVTRSYSSRLFLCAPALSNKNQYEYVRVQCRTQKSLHCCVQSAFQVQFKSGGQLPPCPPFSYPSVLCSKCMAYCSTSVKGGARTLFKDVIRFSCIYEAGVYPTLKGWQYCTLNAVAIKICSELIFNFYTDSHIRYHPCRDSLFPFTGAAA